MIGGWYRVWVRVTGLVGMGRVRVDKGHRSQQSLESADVRGIPQGSVCETCPMVKRPE